MECLNKIKSCKECTLGSLPINAMKPLDEDRTNKKIMICAQNPTLDNSADNKIIDSFLNKLGISREDCYLTYLVKCLTEDNSTPTSDTIKTCLPLLYTEINDIKPHVLIVISSLVCGLIDKDKIKCPIIELKHPLYYIRKCITLDKSSEQMYNDFVTANIASYISKPVRLDLVNKKISFKDTDSAKYFFKLANTLRLYNVTQDNEYRTIAIFVSNKQQLICEILYHNYCYILATDGECDPIKTTLDGSKVRKVYYKSFRDLENFHDVLEKDLNSSNRFVVDYAEYYDSARPEDINYMTFDIETNSSVDVVNTPGEVISIVYRLNEDNYFMILDNGLKNINFDSYTNCRIYSSEARMLADFAKVFRESNLVTGFNIHGFDIIYLINRGKLMGISESEWSPVGKVINNIKEEKDRQNERNIDIKGLDSVDSMIFSKDKFFVYSLDKPSQYNLDYLGHFLKLGQKVHDSRGPSTLWKEDPIKLYEYNIQDVVLCRLIEQYMNMENYLFSFKYLIHTLNLKYSLYNSKIIDYFILSRYSSKYVFPSKHDTAKENLPGAYVKEPVPGIFNNVCITDFSSMYPNIIRNFNLSYETIFNDTSTLTEYIEVWDSSSKCKYFINKSKKGFLPEIVDTFMIMKKEYGNNLKEGKDPLALVKYNAIKAVINGIYGVFAYRYFRLYDIRIARVITAVGRDLITHCEKYADVQDNYQTVMGDSVAGETSILIKHNNILKTLTLVEIFNEFKSDIIIENNKEVIYPNNVQTISWNYDKQIIEFKPVIKFIRHETKKQLYLINDKRSMPIVTEDHSFFIDGKPCSSSYYNNNDKLYVHKDGELVFNKKQIDTIEGSLKLSNKINKICLDAYVDLEIQYRHRNLNRKHTLKKTSKYIYLNYSHCNQHRIYKSLKMPRYIELDYNFGFILGAYISEGSYNMFSTRIVSGEDQEFLDKVYKIASKIFGKDNLNRTKYYISYMGSYAISEMFRKLCGAGSSNKQLPNFYLETNTDFLKGIIEAYQIGDWAKARTLPNLELGGFGGKSRKLTSQLYFLMKYVFEKYFSLKNSYRIDKNVYQYEWRNNIYKTTSIALIKKYKYHSAYKHVYDISVEDNHNFVDILGGAILHNTDSIFIRQKKPDEYLQSITEFHELVEQINLEITDHIKLRYGIDNNYLHMECETIFERVLISQAKKCYYGYGRYIKGKLNDEVKEYGRGISLVKKDTPSGLRPTLKELLVRFIKAKDDIEVKAILRETKTKLKALPYSELLITKQISRELSEYTVMPQHVRAMMFSNKYLGTNFSRDNYKGGLMYCKARNFPDVDAIMLENDMPIPTGFLCDYDKYFDLFVKNKISLFSPDYEKYFMQERSLLEFMK